MGTATLGQAIRNAAEAERASARFYLELVGLADDVSTRAFLEDMAEDEAGHAESLEALGKRVTGGDLAGTADMDVSAVEAVPAWLMADRIDFAQALEIAIEAEHQAAMVYDALADFATGLVEEFLRNMAQTEERHARELIERKAQLL